MKQFYDAIWVQGLGKILATLLILPIRLYQKTLSPLLGDVCRYHPSCSKYAVGALQTHGPFKGLVLTVYRLGRCTPFNKGGLDPVPERGHWKPALYPDGQEQT